MHALSLGTWWIHVASVIEWSVAIVLIQKRGLTGLALAMLPALISAMAACTWHLFDNSETLRPLVTLQAALTTANPGDELVLADGKYTGTGANVLQIDKDITIRALHSGQAILDGEIAFRVIDVGSGTVVLEGLNITKGRRAAYGETVPSSLLRTCFVKPLLCCKSALCGRFRSQLLPHTCPLRVPGTCKEI